MPKLEQRTIEFFFEKFKVTSSDLKAEILPEVTDIIYDYNTLIIKYEKENDNYRQQQILNDIQELEQKISDIFIEMTGGKK